MQYRSFPKIPGLPISILGFGCMRLPVQDGGPARIDEARATRLLRAAIDAGVNYLDTAYPYHGGQSDPFVGRALDRARSDGRINHAGFSFHGSPDTFAEVLEGYDWESCQIQFNLLDVDFQADLASPGALSEEELALTAEVRRYYLGRIEVPCTTCGYCLPCPSGVLIPDVFSMVNTAAMFDSRNDHVAAVQGDPGLPGTGRRCLHRVRRLRAQVPAVHPHPRRPPRGPRIARLTGIPPLGERRCHIC